jgi:hypothetical protein
MQFTSAHSPMPSRPSLTPPKPPEGAKPMKVKKLSQLPFGMQPQQHRSKELVLSVLFLVLCALIGIAILIAKTGVIEIPVFSAFYRERPVTRVVRGIKMTTDDLVHRATDPAYATTSSVSVIVSEEEVTGMLIHLIQSSSTRHGVYVDHPQIVVTPAGLEVVARIRTNAVSVRVFATIVPVVENGRLSYLFKESYVGDLPIPSFIMDKIMKTTFESNLGSLYIAIGSNKLKEIVLKDGSADLVFSKN